MEIYINDGEYVISNAVYGIGKTVKVSGGKTARLYTMKADKGNNEGMEGKSSEESYD